MSVTGRCRFAPLRYEIEAEEHMLLRLLRTEVKFIFSICTSLYTTLLPLLFLMSSTTQPPALSSLSTTNTPHPHPNSPFPHPNPGVNLSSFFPPEFFLKQRLPPEGTRPSPVPLHKSRNCAAEKNPCGRCGTMLLYEQGIYSTVGGKMQLYLRALLGMCSSSQQLHFTWNVRCC